MAQAERSPDEKTVLYLIPYAGNQEAYIIIPDEKNRARWCTDPDKRPALRIGFDPPPKQPPRLAMFGRQEDADIILSDRHYFSRTGHCYLDFNPDTGELILHDLKDTKLYTLDESDKLGSENQLFGSPRQGVVLLNHNLSEVDKVPRYVLEIGPARLEIVPRKVGTKKRKSMPLNSASLGHSNCTQIKQTLARAQLFRPTVQAIETTHTGQSSIESNSKARFTHGLTLSVKA